MSFRERSVYGVVRGLGLEFWKFAVFLVGFVWGKCHVVRSERERNGYV